MKREMKEEEPLNQIPRIGRMRVQGKALWTAQQGKSRLCPACATISQSGRDGRDARWKPARC
ncbi:MAG TPA: hypothetical protein VF771_20135, partial [Longimicrobiaceae bacterium]